jgi:hypothetical protein
MTTHTPALDSSVLASASPARVLLPLSMVVLFEFLAMGLPLPILPGHVHGLVAAAAPLVGLLVGRLTPAVGDAVFLVGAAGAATSGGIAVLLQRGAGRARGES